MSYVCTNGCRGLNSPAPSLYAIYIADDVVGFVYTLPTRGRNGTTVSVVFDSKDGRRRVCRDIVCSAHKRLLASP